MLTIIGWVGVGERLYIAASVLWQVGTCQTQFVRSLERHWQAGEAAQDGTLRPGEPGWLAGQAQAGQALQQGAKGNLSLLARQRRSQAEVDALAKCHVLILLARNIQDRGVRELL